MKKYLLILIQLSLFCSIFAQNIKVDIENSYISVGEWTTMKVTATGDIKDLKFNESDKLEFKQVGKSSSINIINGKKTVSYILNYRVKALAEGNIKLPIFYTTTSSGQKIQSEELTLYVTKLENDKILDHDITNEFESPYVKLFIEIPDRNLYVGEAIPVDVVAYFSTRYQPGIDRSPYIKTGSFILDTGDKYSSDRPEKVINGEKWLQIVWHSHLTPLKSGELDLEIIMDSYIEKPSGNSGFFATTSREAIQTTTKLEKTIINTLPILGKPDSFSGAIGSFSINTEINLADIKVGDPITLSIDIFGEGNFQRISIPTLESGIDDWKIYPESSSYKGTNRSNYNGVKSFEQILSPLHSNVDNLSGLKFSYFDPITESYKEIITQSYPLNVEPGEFLNKENTKIIDETFNNVKQEIIHKKSKIMSNSIPITKRPIFFIVLLLNIAFIISSFVLVIFDKIRKNSSLNLNNRQKSFINNIKKYENNEDYLNGLQSYIDLIKLHLSAQLSINSDSITSSDVTNPKLKAFLIRSEELKYSKEILTKEEYFNITMNILEDLKC